MCVRVFHNAVRVNKILMDKSYQEQCCMFWGDYEQTDGVSKDNPYCGFFVLFLFFFPKFSFLYVNVKMPFFTPSFFLLFFFFLCVNVCAAKYMTNEVMVLGRGGGC